MTTPRRLTKLKQVANQRFEDVVVVLEDIYDPHNAMAALRNCDAFGVQTIHFIFDQQKPFNPKKIGKSSSASANKWLDFKIWSSSQACFDHLQGAGYRLWVTVVDQAATPIWQLDFNQPKIALVFGNEHQGVSVRAIKQADRLIFIPMYGFVDSLNLSVSVGITLYELRRQRRAPAHSSWHDQLIKRFRSR